MAGKLPGSSRSRTDARLKTERAKTDDELERRTRASADDADAVVKKARNRAAGVIQTERRRADAHMLARKASPGERSAVDAKRSRDEKVLQREYARADKVTASERATRARLVAELLAEERRDTDKSLLLERADADVILSRRDEFLGLVSHDLRNELGALTFNTSLLLSGVGDDGDRDVLRHATNIQRTTLRMNRLIGDLLDIVSIHVGKFKVISEDRGVCATMEEIVESFRAIASAKGVSISMTLRNIDPPLSARFDGQRLQQVLGNLITNALKYTAEGGAIAVCAELKGDAICFSVADRGAGIPADRLEAIFDRFSQGARPDRKGLGLGLYIARHIVEAHGGRIWAESEPGRGSTFYFTLPLRAAGSRRESLPRSISVVSHGRNGA